MGETLWAVEDAELVVAGTANEAIEAELDARYPDPIEGTITVVEYRRMTPSVHDCGDPLNMVLERLDEEYGDPNGNWDSLTDAMKEAEQTFLRAVLSEYKSWMCEPTDNRVTVDALEWTREHRPDWLTEPSADGGE